MFVKLYKPKKLKKNQNSKLFDLTSMAVLKMSFSKLDTTNWSDIFYEIKVVNDTIPSYKNDEIHE